MGVCHLHGVGCRCATSRRALPHNAMVVAQATHTCVLEVPQDHPGRAQPLDAKHHIISLEWNDEEVDDEFLRVNEDVDDATDSCPCDAVL
jgi:hypothetical protein